MFDWTTFLDRHGVPYKEGGKSTARGNIYVDCPFCGAQGHGKAHMGISVNGKGWGCWINGEHRGVAPVRLVQALLGCSRERAVELTGARVAPPAPTTNSVADMLRALEGPVAKQSVPGIDWPKNIEPLTKLGNSPLSNPAKAYLQRRGYSAQYSKWLCDRYDLRWTLRGPFAYRICIPVYDEKGGLVTWVGRATNADSELRYKALSQDVDKARAQKMPAARAPITDCLLDQDLLSLGGEVLVITEGFFDAAKVQNAFGPQFDNDVGMATCLFGQNISPAQRVKLLKVAHQYERKYVMLDTDAALRGFFVVLDQLAPFGFAPLELPAGAKDPDSLSVEVLRRLLRLS